jgi:hypothetical protein
MDLPASLSFSITMGRIPEHWPVVYFRQPFVQLGVGSGYGGLLEEPANLLIDVDVSIFYDEKLLHHSKS